MKRTIAMLLLTALCVTVLTSCDTSGGLIALLWDEFAGVETTQQYHQTIAEGGGQRCTVSAPHTDEDEVADQIDHGADNGGDQRAFALFLDHVDGAEEGDKTGHCRSHHQRGNVLPGLVEISARHNAGN